MNKTVLAAIIVAVIAIVIGALAISTLSPTQPEQTPTQPAQTSTPSPSPTSTESPTTVYTLKLSIVFAIPGGVDAQWPRYFASLVENMTNNRVHIEIYYSGEGAPPTEAFEATQQGVFDLIAAGLYYETDKEAALALFHSRPGPLTTPWDVYYYAHRVEDILKEIIEEKYGLVFVSSVFQYRPPEPFMSRVPIKSLKDLKGKMIRSTGMSADFYTALGGQVVFIPHGEILQALRLGNLDACESSDLYTNYKLGFADAAKYALLPKPGVGLHCEALTLGVLLANPKTWNTLPDDIKTAIKAAAEVTFMVSGYHMYRLQYIDAVKLWNATGLVKYAPDDDLIINTGAQVYVKYAKKDPTGLKMVLRTLEVFRELGYNKWADALEKALKEEGLLE